ncbi:pyrroline-5-carboxylate reductase [Hydrogenophilus thermoluteolus]|uniref:pyrroline-5-carboxylate reductase n=1 Tax=Hydrogenophilus thermoluteolus TaxID=297 RepID=UPI003F67925D
MKTHQEKEQKHAVEFLGGGNMAEAILGGLVDRRVTDAKRIHVVDPNPDRRTALESRYGVKALPVVDDPFFETDLIVLAVKPQVVATALAPLAGRVGRMPVLSIMAGVPIARIAALLGDTAPIIRAMPNTPALVGAGMSGLYAPPEVGVTARQLAQKVMEAVGEVVWVENEAAIDAVTAVSGSGPAYGFLFMEALARAGVELGLPADVARRLAVGTLLGAAKLADASADPLDVLRARVTSPGERPLRHWKYCSRMRGTAFWRRRSRRRTSARKSWRKERNGWGAGNFSISFSVPSSTDFRPFFGSRF